MFVPQGKLEHVIAVFADKGKTLPPQIEKMEGLIEDGRSASSIPGDEGFGPIGAGYGEG